MRDVDVVVVGAGAAGLSLTLKLARAPGPLGVPPRIALLEAPPGPARSPDRTWCFWEREAGPYDAVVRARWDRLRVRDAQGRPHTLHLGARHYKMIRSPDFTAMAARRLARLPHVRRLTATVHQVLDDPDRDGALVHGTTPHGAPVTVRGRWAFDSRPPPHPPPARSTLLQHFHGWFLRCPHDAFDPAVVDLMDFRTPQPPRGLSFGYVLPLGRREALVEYTEFSPAPLTPPAYQAALEHYTRRVLHLGQITVHDTEHGVIPMTDAALPRRVGRAVFRVGAAAGATRPATGYAFTAIQRQTDAIAAAYRRGRTPTPPPAYPARHRAMDAVLLRALTTARLRGDAFFPALFRRNPPGRLLRFLDGDSHPWEEWALGGSAPLLPMLRSALELPLLRRRATPPPRPHPATTPHPPPR